MKLTKTASGKTTIKMSRSEWTEMGKKAGWLKVSELSNSHKQLLKSWLVNNSAAKRIFLNGGYTMFMDLPEGLQKRLERIDKTKDLGTLEIEVESWLDEFSFELENRNIEQL